MYVAVWSKPKMSWINVRGRMGKDGNSYEDFTDSDSVIDVTYRKKNSSAEVRVRMKYTCEYQPLHVNHL